MSSIGAPLGKAFTFSPTAEEEESSAQASGPAGPSSGGPSRPPPSEYEREPIHIESPMPPPPGVAQRRSAQIEHAARVARQQAAFEGRMREIAKQESRNNGMIFLVAGVGIAAVLAYVYLSKRGKTAAVTAAIAEGVKAAV